MRTLYRQLIIFSMVMGLSGSFVAADVPLGHADFMPTPEHPVGFRGDGTGRFSGATPPTDWDDTTGKNILWKAPLPNISYSAPIVVGKQVFVLCDGQSLPHPDFVMPQLIAIDTETGQVQWQKSIDHLQTFAPAEAQQARQQWRQVLATRARKTLNIHRMQKAGYDLEAMKTGPGKQLVVDTHPEAYVRIYRGKPMIELPKSFEKLESELAEKYGLRRDPWHNASDCRDNIITVTFATPVSDGKHIWVTTGFNSAACFDLKGDLKWIRYFPLPTDARGRVPKVSANYVPSPTLRNGVLITNLSRVMRALDPETGKTLWEKELSWPHIYACGTQQHVQLPLGDKTVECVYAASGQLLRLSDGEILAEGIGKPGSGTTPLYDGKDTIFTYTFSAGGGGEDVKGGNPDFTKAGLYAVQLKLDSADRASYKIKWFRPGKDIDWDHRTPVYHDGKLLAFNSILDAETGKDIHRTRNPKPEHLHTLVGKDLLFAVAGGKRRARDGKRQVYFYQLPSLKVTRQEIVYADGDEAKRTQRLAECNITMWEFLTRNGAFFQGGRMYLRSHDHLYCIGK